MDKLTTNEDPAAAQDSATGLDGFSLPLPEPAVLRSAQINEVGGGRYETPGFPCVVCGLGAPIRPPPDVPTQRF
jgi:hypothetical protein